jgi:hypothetical protein
VLTVRRLIPIALLAFVRCAPAPPAPVVVTLPEPPRASASAVTLAPPPAPRAPPAPSRPSGALAGDDDMCPRSGVKECDDYAEEVLLCIMLNAGEPLAAQLPNLCRQWVEMATTPEGRAAAAGTCKALRASLGKGCR